MPKINFIFHFIGAVSFCIAGCEDGDQTQVSGEYAVSVAAGDFDRNDAVVAFSLPDYTEPGVYRMNAVNSGESVLVQVDQNSKARFILDELDAGQAQTFAFRSDEPVTDYPEGINSRLEERTITFYDGSSGMFSYYHSEHELPDEFGDAYLRGGYLHPVRTPDGTVVTEQFSEGHPHQLGIFSAWTSTEFEGNTPDFWNIQDETGTIVTDSLDKIQDGPVYGGFRARHGYVDLSEPEPQRALNEQWDLKAYPSPEESPYRFFDLTVTQSADTDKPLHLPQYHYGGVAVRGNDVWMDPDSVSISTSGGHDRPEANEERVRWVNMSGVVDGRSAGIAQLAHPENIRHPQPVRVHPDDPYYVYTPMQLGDMSIEPGAPLELRYRFVVFDGEPDHELLNRIWNDYAYPPGVTVSKNE